MITDHYLKLARAVLVSKTSAMYVASIFYNHWIIQCRIPAFLLAKNCTQFVSKFFETIRNFLRLNLLTTTAYHRIAVMIEKTNKKLITAQSRYKHHPVQRTGLTVSFKPSKPVYANCSLVALTAANGLTTDSFPKFLPKTGPISHPPSHNQGSDYWRGCNR